MPAASAARLVDQWSISGKRPKAGGINRAARIFAKAQHLSARVVFGFQRSALVHAVRSTKLCTRKEAV